MTFAIGDRVHLPRLGTGRVVAVRNRRVVVEIKGHEMVVDATQLEPAEKTPKKKPAPSASAEIPVVRPSSAAASIDLHGKTVEAAIEALDSFLNDAMLASLEEVRVIHGRSGGRIRDAVHRRLAQLASVRSFRLDRRNAGVTIVTL